MYTSVHFPYIVALYWSHVVLYWFDICTFIFFTMIRNDSFCVVFKMSSSIVSTVPFWHLLEAVVRIPVWVKSSQIEKRSSRFCQLLAQFSNKQLPSNNTSDGDSRQYYVMQKKKTLCRLLLSYTFNITHLAESYNA